MLPELSCYARRLHAAIQSGFDGEDFSAWALELFKLQFGQNAFYREFSRRRNITPQAVEHWTQIPFVPTGAFKVGELSGIPSGERTAVFHSSGTTTQIPGSHFHNAESLAIYEASIWTWFRHQFGEGGKLLFLTPNRAAAPHSSLVHMFETLRQKCGPLESAFSGNTSADGAWMVDFASTMERLRNACETGRPLSILGTAFSFVHLLDHFADNQVSFRLPEASRVMETGGYKNQSRTLSKGELHALITQRLGVADRNIICEYGMSELSSQAYGSAGRHQAFQFPPWARAQIISAETGREVGEGITGLIRVFDLANVFSVAAVQTEDLAIRRGGAFELAGRAPLSEPRGCSLMSA